MARLLDFSEVMPYIVARLAFFCAQVSGLSREHGGLRIPTCGLRIQSCALKRAGRIRKAEVRGKQEGLNRSIT
jgi:hypothetical protein